MADCEKHRYDKWKFIQCPTTNGVKFKEFRSCADCGKSQIRSVDRFGDNTEEKPDAE